tara:strand:- start:5650 stop:5796 length:147 start_codon:yes stop_codon:yes gene_type:complete
MRIKASTILIFIFGVALIVAFDYAMDKDAQQMCERGIGDAGVCEQGGY